VGVAPPEFKLGIDLSASCSGCGRELPVPESVERGLSVPGNGSKVFVDVPAPCPQCGGKRAIVKLKTSL
jgi:DNA-directed RNA polymerase subunit RPC12/RpoP